VRRPTTRYRQRCIDTGFSLPDSAHKNVGDTIHFAYNSDILRSNGNKKYARRADRKDINLALVSIHYHTHTDLIADQNFHFVSDSGEVKLLNTRRLFKKTRQGVFIHLLYLGLVAWVQADEDVVYPIGIYIGPPLSIYNIIKADYANYAYKKDLRRLNLYGKTIKPGEKMYAIIGYRSKVKGALSLVMDSAQ
jgi:hypothetical protein